jgi:hypothetical protein
MCAYMKIFCAALMGTDGPTDQRTDGRINIVSYRGACMHLKTDWGTLKLAISDVWAMCLIVDLSMKGEMGHQYNIRMYRRNERLCVHM